MAVSLLAAGSAHAGKVGGGDILEVALRLDAPGGPYTAFQAQVVYDSEHFAVLDLSRCLSGVPAEHRRSLTDCTHPRPGVIQIAVTNLLEPDAVIPKGLLGTITFAVTGPHAKGGALGKSVRPAPAGASKGIRLEQVKVYRDGKREVFPDRSPGVSLVPIGELPRKGQAGKRGRGARP